MLSRELERQQMAGKREKAEDIVVKLRLGSCPHGAKLPLRVD